MDLILNAAKDKLNGQYMFLTPQEMGYFIYFMIIEDGINFYFF